MSEDDDKFQKLTASLMQLHVSVVADNASRSPQVPAEPPINEEESTQDKNTIRNEPIKSKISMSHSKMLSKLPSRATSSLLTVSKRDNRKVQLRFKSIGSIDQLRPAVFKISRDSKFLSVSKFLQKRLKIPKVYCYLANSIVPNPDDGIGDLYELFRSGDELIVSYCNIVAFG